MNKATHPVVDTVLFNTPITMVIQNDTVLHTVTVCGFAVKRALLLDLAGMLTIDCWGTSYPIFNNCSCCFLGLCFWVHLTVTTCDVHRLNTLEMYSY